VVSRVNAGFYSVVFSADSKFLACVVMQSDIVKLWSAETKDV